MVVIVLSKLQKYGHINKRMKGKTHILHNDDGHQVSERPPDKIKQPLSQTNSIPFA